MRFRDKLALSVAPIVLRIMVGVVFLWLGLSRVVDRVPVAGSDVAILADLGVVGGAVGAAAVPDAPQQAGPEQAPPVEVASRPEPVRARRLYQDALTIYNAAYPRPGESGERPPSTWPGALAGGNAPVVLSWIGAMTALIGGGLILLGLLTRLWAAMLMVLMLLAAWLTQLGPAIQSGKTRMGVLPDRPLLDASGGQELVWQFVLLMAALTLFLAGSGAWAVDRAIFGKGGGGHG